MKTQRQNSLLRVVKFVLFSISAGVIQILVFTLLNELAHWPQALMQAKYGPNYFVALAVSVLWNFTLNRKFTFQSAANVPVAMLKIFAYYCVFTPLSLWMGISLTVRAGWNEYVVLLGTMLCNVVTEFLVCRFFVYRDSMDTNERARGRTNRARGKDPAQKP